MPNPFTAETAWAHAHTDVRAGQIQITSWVGCLMLGTVGGASVSLWADSVTCPLKAKVPGTFYVNYDFVCKQVLALSNGPLPPLPVPDDPTPELLRTVAWPVGEAKQSAIIATQWAERYKFKRHLSGAWAEFEKAPPSHVPTPRLLRKVAWPTGEAKQNAVIEAQRAEGFRFKRHLFGAWAEFEKE